MSDNEIILNYFEPKNLARDSIITCRFKIKDFKSNDKLFLALNEDSDWVTNLGLPDGFNIKLNGDDFELFIVGRGHDSRCTACRSFRTCLRNKLKKEGIIVKQRGVCRFDKESNYLFEKEELRKNINRMRELGLADD
jgi:hypothetical protein